ncbi:S41 family peptidase [Mucilaginibacter mali]|uniref:S41 family peptidase n=1 Tax=Mucilaginibacter mali TaxID=2740462 RepID=A0A7D4Q2K9_9SPHI|nr:S41 family peptidase [Mucilaginibacter mali]QKJ31406.1 S41 family peptidase [Mucilaginibacter mali]
MKRAAAIIFRSIVLILTGVTIGLYISNDNFPGRRISNPFAKDDKVEQMLHLVKAKYVDTVNMVRFEGETINNMLQNLDPHSLYLPPQQAQSINERLEGEFNGIGIEYQLLRDTLYVTQVQPGGPAEKAGIKTGQRLITVNNKPFSGTGLTADKVNTTLRGEKGTSIILGLTTIDNKAKPQNYTVTRGHVDLSSLDAAYMASGDIGYIKLSKFAATSDADFRAALRKLQVQGVKKLVVDLRSNGGGYLSAATSLADEFLTKGKLIVYTQGVHEPRTDYFATDSGMFQQGNLAVLIDEYSASASEILAGCLQDLDRATLIGRRSFGKGLVQEQFPFGDGSAINLTVARYYTPSGRSIQKSYKNGIESYHNEIAERMQKGELYSAANTLKDSSFLRKSNYHTSKGKKVYSGGGIMPDIFIPADTNTNTVLIQELNQRQLFTAFIIDKLYPQFKNYRNDDDFVARYNVSDAVFDTFIQYASGTLKQMDSPEIKRSKNNIKKLLKAYMARFEWGDTAYYRVVNADDPALVKAIEVVK